MGIYRDCIVFGALAGLLVAAAAASPQDPVQPPTSAHSARLVIEAELERHADGAAVDIGRLLYEFNAYTPHWTAANGPLAARKFLDHLQRAGEDGLCARDEQVESLRRALDDHDSPRQYGEQNWQHALEIDVQLTLAIAAYAWELHAGRDAPDEAEEAQLAQVAATLVLVRDPESVQWAVSRLEPVHPEYHALRDALRRYRAMTNVAGAPVPSGVLLRRTAGEDERPLPSGDERALRLIVERLRGTGDLPEMTMLPDPLRYDEGIEEAVRRFQERHGLTVDGIVGPETLQALNVSSDERAEVIALNMDRWRRVPVREGRHVRVNIPAFTLWAMRGQEVDLEMRVVVGTRETQTPVFGDEISYLEFSPDWNVPERIAREDLIPRIARDPGYLRRMDFEVVDGWDDDAPVVDPSSVDWSAARTNFPYRLRQRPGSENAMGRVKFMFPNEYLVYLHDTPATHRFAARQRTFSNGCVRVAKPEALAAWLLDDPFQWGPDAVLRAMEDNQRQVVYLDEAVPVELRYFTTWVDEEGTVQFRPDIYGRDASALQDHTCPQSRRHS